MLADELLIPAVHAVVDPLVQDARRYGPLPHLRSEEFLCAPRLVQLAVLAVLGESWALGHPVRALLREVSDDIHADDDAFWRRVAENHIDHAVLVARRAEPGPMAGAA